MKVLFTGLFPIWQCHIVAECNFIEEHLLAGDKVELLACDGSLHVCDANPQYELSNCLVCMNLRKNTVSMLSSAVKNWPLVSKDSQKKVKKTKVPIFQSIDQLKSFTCFGAPVGLDVISSIITALGDHDFNPIKHANRVKKTIIDYLGVYLTAKDYLENEKYSLVYIFNGRFAPSKAWIRACEELGTDYFTLERLVIPDRVLKIKNGAFHDLASYASRINEFWSKHQNNADILNEAVNFFEERPKGLLTGWYSFVAGQEKSRLPEGWNPKKRNMAIFSSTESEFAGIPEVLNGALYADQKECYLRIAELLHRKNPTIHLHLRIHPNSKNEKRRWWEDQEFKQLSNLTVIPPKSPVSSYELLRSCEKTVVFMTTMGIEATYWGKPSILLSNSMYKGIGAVYEPSTEEEALQLILEDDLKAKPREATLAYSAFLRMGDPKLPYSDALDHCTLTFKGERPNASKEVLHSLWKWNNYINKPWIPNMLKRIWERHEFKKMIPTLTHDS